MHVFHYVKSNFCSPILSAKSAFVILNILEQSIISFSRCITLDCIIRMYLPTFEQCIMLCAQQCRYLRNIFY